ncbi:MAG: hypothetical protein RL651_800 [Pseudomonadota bacterium]|jgi:uncharacterized membrane protein
MKRFAVVIASVLTLALTACGGGGANVRSEVTTVSKGQQLIDLKKALGDGAITQDEYDKEKSKILSTNG